MKFFLLRQSSLRNPQYNLALEEAICLSLAESEFSGGVRLWRNPPVVVTGLSEHPDKTVSPSFLKDFTEDFPQRKLWPPKLQSENEKQLVRRASGGGTVFQNLEDNLNFSFFISLLARPELFPVHFSYEKILGMVSTALQAQGIISLQAGKSDLALSIAEVQKKISGNAQFRKKNCLTHHGTLILNARITENISRYLLHPPEEPDYRQKRKHNEFLSALPETFSEEKFGDDLKDIFSEFLDGAQLSELPLSLWRRILHLTKKLYFEKYTNLDYILNRN